ncbi:MAG: MerR family transcriptional regulator [Solirubrobacterales bacterium]
MEAGAEELSIDELSARVGVTPRNIRAYQTQGLLPLPEKRGRSGVYGPDHVTRLEMIRDMREQGIGLPAIERLTAWGEGMAPEELRAVAATLLGGLVDEEPQVYEQSDVYEVWGEDIEMETLERAQRAGFFEPREDGTVLVRSPTLRAHGMQLRTMGGTFEDAVELTEVLREHLEAIAAAFNELFVERITEQVLEDSGPDPDGAEALKRVAQALELAKPMATSAVNAAFRIVLQDQIERTIESGFAEHVEALGNSSGE